MTGSDRLRQTKTILLNSYRYISVFAEFYTTHHNQPIFLDDHNNALPPHHPLLQLLQL